MFRNALRLAAVAAIVMNFTACSRPSGPEPQPPPPPAAETARPAEAGGPASPPQAQHPSVFFIDLEDGQEVTSPLTVRFGVEGMKVSPTDAGDVPNSGHHHLIIDGGPIPKGQAVPKDERHLHFGGGQTEATIELEPGEHTLTLQFADFEHISYGPSMSATLTVRVVKEAEEQTEGAQAANPSESGENRDEAGGGH